MNKVFFLFLFLSMNVFADESVLDTQYKKELENAKKLNEIFNLNSWQNVKFKSIKNNTIKNFTEFSDFEKSIYVLIVAENTSRSLSNLEKSWKDKIQSNENFEGLPVYINGLHDERKVFYKNYLNYAQNLVLKFENNLTKEESELIIKQIKDFSQKEKLD